MKKPKSKQTPKSKRSAKAAPSSKRRASRPRRVPASLPAKNLPAFTLTSGDSAIRAGDSVEYIGTGQPQSGVRHGDQGIAVSDASVLGTVNCRFHGRTDMYSVSDLRRL